MVPSIKGTAFSSAADDLMSLVAEGEISRDELETRFSKEELATLDAKVLAGSWYPIEMYNRILELLLQKQGGGRIDYLVWRGARAAERMLSSGIYRQLERAERIRVESPDSRARIGNLMMTLSAAIYNFTRWRYIPASASDPGYTIEVSEARHFPDNARHTVTGFIQYTADRLVPVPVRIESERPDPDRILFRAYPAR